MVSNVDISGKEDGQFTRTSGLKGQNPLYEEKSIIILSTY